MTLPTQLRDLAALVERVEDATEAEVQTAQPAGVDPDGELLRADLTVVVPTEALEEAQTDDEATVDNGGTEESPAKEESDNPSLTDLTDTVRGDVLAVVKHGLDPETRADDRDVTPAAIHHNLRAAREQLGVEDLSEIVPAAPRGGDDATDNEAAEEHTSESTTDADDSPEWAVTDGGTATATAQTGARVTCQNCGSTVTRDYARVFSPDNVDGVRTCPDCPDLIREGDGTLRKKRSGPHAVSPEEGDDV